VNDETSASLTLLAVRSREDAFDWWQRNLPVVRGTTLILSHEEPSNLVVPVHRTFGRTLHLLSVFSSPNLTVLNDRIVQKTLRERTAKIAVDFLVAFDTNAASFLRGLFAARNNEQVSDLRQFLRGFGGNKVNWDVRSYLHENVDALLSRHHDQYIYETVLASEQLAGLNVDQFITTGAATTIRSIEELRVRACAEIADFLAKLGNGWHEMVRHRREPLYAALLYMMILQWSQPSRSHAVEKLKKMVEFMHSELSSLFLVILWAAWRWFSGDSQVSLFDALQPRAKHPLARAANISWDLYHMTQQPGMVMTSRKGADVLIPAFLTADQKLAKFWQVYPLRSCWARNGLDHPFCVPAIDVQQELSALIVDDPVFAERFLSVQAHQTRGDRLLKSGPPPIRDLIQKLEQRLCS
jgi:hypothetical protein